MNSHTVDQPWLAFLRSEIVRDGRPALRVNAQRSELIHLVRSVRLACPQDGDVPPNARAYRNAEDVVVGLWNADWMRPHTLGAVAEGGILLTYRAKDPTFRLTFEIDNDGDVIGVVSHGKKVLLSQDVTPPAERSDIVQDFQKFIANASRLQGSGAD